MLAKYAKLLILISLVLLTAPVHAQLFQKAPKYKKKIRKIIEWNKSALNAKAKEGSTSVFDAAGRLKRYKTPSSDSRFTYNSKGQLIKVKESGIAQRLTQISYKGNATIKELSFRGKVYKTEAYYKDAKLLEEKTFVKGAELGNKYLLKEKTVHYYNKFDSLEREVHYIYSIPHKNKVEKRRTIYQYDLGTKNLVSKIFYDTDGSIRKKSTYEYKADQLVKRKDVFPSEKRNTQMSYLYKDNKIWQKIFEDKNKKDVWIYADDRLIRLRSYFGDKLFQIVDYQYLYY